MWVVFLAGLKAFSGLQRFQNISHTIHSPIDFFFTYYQRRRYADDILMTFFAQYPLLQKLLADVAGATCSGIQFHAYHQAFAPNLLHVGAPIS